MMTATPMLRQYMGIKSEYPDTILFFRMGDFYEMFFEDAKLAARVLGITLTSRGTHQNEKVPMCGVPHHAAKAYVAKLLENGLKVAICDQTEDPRLSKGIVKREVVRIVTPGSMVSDGEIDSKSNLYLAAVSANSRTYGLAHVDLSTGAFRLTEVENVAELLDELGRIGPAELLVSEQNPLLDQKSLSAYRVEKLNQAVFEHAKAEKLLKEQLGVASLAGFGCEHWDQGVIAAGAVVHYLRETQKGRLEHIKELTAYHLGEFMFLDEHTIANLELFKTMRRQSVQGTLCQVLDHTLTPMGSRLLKYWIAYPLLDIRSIQNRQVAVRIFREAQVLREEIREQLAGIYDLERLNGRVVLGRANARDLIALKESIRKLPEIKNRLLDLPSDLLAEIVQKLDLLSDVAQWIEQTVCDEPPVSIKEGGIIKEGYHPELDQLIRVTRDGKGWIADMTASEQKRTGIHNLKVGYNRVFGYYIEISKSNLHLAPPDYIRKQTLTNGERYITEELKKYEELVLGAEEKKVTLEYELFEQVRNRIAQQNQRIKETGKWISHIDVLAGLAEAAELNRYVRPEVHMEGHISIEDGRHPVIEQTVREEEFVPNDIHLDNQEQQFLIITGPNMAGKSTILRQVALTVLMAQIGSFVPAAKAMIGIVDRIFTRIGASDDLAKGQSTFMVEMNETANILRYATPQSLVILDEIGRGTSTYDGLSIAWAVAEALHDLQDKGIRTLFATHYHELTELLTIKKRAKNYQIAVKEWNDRIIFLRKLVPGGASRSYGIQVARIAGIPQPVIDRAKEILETLEDTDRDEMGRPGIARSYRHSVQEPGSQLSLFGNQDESLVQWIKGLDIKSMTPLESLNELNKLQEYVDYLKK
ncbi:MAG: DNA mismatch repair protein MutS [Desulfobacteraceae bacterium]|nr:MAG: DNA mismatch repair protein MutS [Desulfobacteraceae bacterium]